MSKQVVSLAEWRSARADLLKKEKKVTQELSSIAKQRQGLPIVKVEHSSRFTFENSDNQTLNLLDLFEGRRQLIIYHFMLSDTDAEGCVGCSFLMDHIPHNQALDHLHSRDTTFIAVAPASVSKVAAYRARMGWTFPFLSSRNTFREADKLGEEVTWKPGNGYFGFACFLRDGDEVFHTYSTTDRGTESILSTYALLDMTSLGRQEIGNGMGNFKLHDLYSVRAD